MVRSLARRVVPKMCGDESIQPLRRQDSSRMSYGLSYRVRGTARQLTAEDHIVSESDALLFARRIPVRSAA